MMVAGFCQVVRADEDENEDVLHIQAVYKIN